MCKRCTACPNGLHIMIESIHTKPRLVFGCGNTLFGDDGFGPVVIGQLASRHHLPEDTAFVDAGTSVRDILFDILLSENRPKRIVIVDASLRNDKKPGELSEIDIESMDPRKTADFSLHQFPTINMLKELQLHTDVDVRVLVVQPEHIPSEIEPGLSGSTSRAVEPMCDYIMDILGEPVSHHR